MSLTFKPIATGRWGVGDRFRITVDSHGLFRGCEILPETIRSDTSNPFPTYAQAVAWCEARAAAEAAPPDDDGPITVMWLHSVRPAGWVAGTCGIYRHDGINVMIDGEVVGPAAIRLCRLRSRRDVRAMLRLLGEGW